MTSTRTGRPDWLGDVSAGVDAWTRRRRVRPSRTATRQDTAAQVPEADPESVARKILLDQLTGQARSRKELADKLATKNVPDDVATRLLDRFEEVGLVDDEAFARSWVAVPRSAGKGLARRALAQELRRKGDRRRGRPRGRSTRSTPPTRRRPPGRWSARSCARCRGSTTPRPPGGWSACWPARATAPAWRSRSSSDELAQSRTPGTGRLTGRCRQVVLAWHADEREILTYETFGTAVRELAQQVVDSGYEPDLILSIARGGLGLGMGLGYALDVKNLSAVNVEFYTGVDERLDVRSCCRRRRTRVDLAGLRVLIADDVADTGKTLEIVRDFCADHVAEARVAVIYEKPWTWSAPTTSGGAPRRGSTSPGRQRRRWYDAAGPAPRRRDDRHHGWSCTTAAMTWAGSCATGESWAAAARRTAREHARRAGARRPVRGGQAVPGRPRQPGDRARDDAAATCRT